jgi:hypothetical protein
MADSARAAPGTDDRARLRIRNRWNGENAHVTLSDYTHLPHIARQIEHDVPVPPPDAVSARRRTSDRLPQAEESSRRLIEDRPRRPRQSAWRLPGIGIGVAEITKSPATAAPCVLIQLGGVT